MNIYRRKGKDGKLLSPFYYYRFTYEGREYSGSTRTPDASLARKILSKKHTMVVEGRQLDKVTRRDIPTVASYTAVYLASYARDKRSRVSDESIIKRSILPAFGKKRLDQIRPSDVESWRNARLQARKPKSEKPLAPATVMNEMACLKTIMGLAVRDHYLQNNPVRSVKMPRVNNRRDRVITPEEYRRLLRAITADSRHLRPILVLAHETGMRRGEILGLRWKDLERCPGMAVLSETKNGESRRVPLSQAAQQALRGWPRRVDTDAVFPGPDGGPVTEIGKAWRTLCRRARVENARFHDFRHTFTTRLLEAGVDVRSIMAITGHKSVSMFQRYSHPSDSHLRSAVERVGSGQVVSEPGTVGRRVSATRR